MANQMAELEKEAHVDFVNCLRIENVMFRVLLDGFARLSKKYTNKCGLE